MASVFGWLIELTAVNACDGGIELSNDDGDFTLRRFICVSQSSAFLAGSGLRHCHLRQTLFRRAQMSQRSMPRRLSNWWPAGADLAGTRSPLTSRRGDAGFPGIAGPITGGGPELNRPVHQATG